MKRTRYIDVVMDTPPGPDTQFIETEDDQGHGVGQNRGLSWVPPTGDDPHWRLRIPDTAYGSQATWIGFASLVLVCAVVLALAWVIFR